MKAFRSSLRSILMLSFHLHSGLSSGLVHSSVPTEILYTPLISGVRGIYIDISWDDSLVAARTGVL